MVRHVKVGQITLVAPLAKVVKSTSDTAEDSDAFSDIPVKNSRKPKPKVKAPGSGDDEEAKKQPVKKTRRKPAKEPAGGKT